MDLSLLLNRILASFVILVVLVGCVSSTYRRVETPQPSPGFLSAKWGTTIEEVKEAIRRDGNRWFQDSTEKPPWALYASGTYWDFSAIFSYLFTPKTKKLYRIDVTFSDLRAYEKAKEQLVRMFKEPAYKQVGVEHWSWDDKSLVILQRDPTTVQVSFSSGPFLILNQKEGDGLR